MDKLDKLNFVLKACSTTKATTSREKEYWERQHAMYQNGIRNNEMHDFTLVELSKKEQI